MSGKKSLSLPKETTYVYKLYDGWRRLLYVGATVNVKIRLGGHILTSDWYPKVKYKVSIPYSTRRQAFIAEKKAIQYENPIYNRQRVRQIVK